MCVYRNINKEESKSNMISELQKTKMNLCFRSKVFVCSLRVSFFVFLPQNSIHFSLIRDVLKTPNAESSKTL